MKLCLLGDSVQYFSWFEDMTVITVIIHERANFCVKLSYWESRRICAAYMHEQTVLMDGQQRYGGPNMSTEVRTNLQSVQHRRASRCMDEGGIIVHPV